MSLITLSLLSFSHSDGGRIYAKQLTLGRHFETFVQSQLRSGRYGNASEVLRDALRLMEERERKLAALDLAIERGMADLRGDRIYDADEVFDELEAELEGLPDSAPA